MPGQKIGVLFTPDFYDAIRKNSIAARPPILLEKPFSFESRAFLFTKNHFLFDEFDRKLQQYIEGALIEYNIRKYYDENSNHKRYQKYSEPFAVLTLGELEAGFVVCVVPFFLSLLVFCFEWMLVANSLTIFLIIFKTFYEIKTIEQKQQSELRREKLAAARALLQRTSNEVLKEEN